MPLDASHLPFPLRELTRRPVGAVTHEVMHHDTLSDVLRSIRLRSAVFYFVSCDGEWAAEAPASCDIATAVMPQTEHVMEYHVVTHGECWAAIVGEPPRR